MRKNEIFTHIIVPPLLIITGMVSGHQYEIDGRKNLTNSIYVLNLNTLKPTKNSYRQIQLPLELQNVISCEINNKYKNWKIYI